MRRPTYSGRTMRSLLLRPGWILTHLVVVALAVLFVILGVWQLERHAEVAEENERILAQLQADPLPLDEALDQPDPDLLPVTVTGTFEAEGELQLAPRSRNDLPGFEVLTPLRLPDGSAVIVNRGWVPLDLDPPPSPGGTRQLEGRIRTSGDSRQVLTDDDGAVTLVSTVDTDVLARQVDGLIAERYVELVDEEAREAGAIPRPAPPVEPDAGPHLSYAAQWFAFTAIGLIGYPLLLRRRVADVVAAEDPVQPAESKASDPVASR